MGELNPEVQEGYLQRLDGLVGWRNSICNSGRVVKGDAGSSASRDCALQRKPERGMDAIESRTGASSSHAPG